MADPNLPIPTTPIECWRSVVGFAGRYSVSDLGRVRRDTGGRGAVAGRILTPKWNQSRWFVSLGTSQFDRKNYYIHRLVLEAFVGPCPEGMEGCHNTGNPDDNRLIHLRWGTPESNQADRLLHGTSNRGRSDRFSELTIRVIRRLKGRLLIRELAEIFACSPTHMSSILHGRKWAHV